MGKIKKKHLLRIGFPASAACQAALQAMAHETYARKGRETKLQLLQALLHNPAAYVQHEVLGETARLLQPESHDPHAPQKPLLRQEALPIAIYGREGIDQGALHQIHVAAKLPVARAVALMPDAHQGFGLPIGGVLATEGAVIPYAVGVDIGCRMCLTVYDLPTSHLKQHAHALKRALLEHTTFGSGHGPEQPMDDAVLDRPEFQEISLLRGLHGKAWKQIGSSGSGNHFVEFGELTLTETDPRWQVPTGSYLALLSHSGSRGLGAGIAQHYTKVAMQTTRLPREAKQLAWLSLDSQAGQEYWLAMTLAGDYASACHHHIHQRLAKAIGERPLFWVENHHNFAWKEQLADGTEVIVHRKGATPAGAGVLGIIPGSMTAPGYLVRGRGAYPSLQSASHGAGRRMSRTQAKNAITGHQLRQSLREHEVTLLGGGIDEAPMAYKDIDQVMAHQQDLVEVLGSFRPRLVRMAGD
jgi:tRNA-splicing ligase RtcB